MSAAKISSHAMPSWKIFRMISRESAAYSSSYAGTALKLDPPDLPECVVEEFVITSLVNISFERYYSWLRAMLTFGLCILLQNPTYALEDGDPNKGNLKPTGITRRAPDNLPNTRYGLSQNENQIKSHIDFNAADYLHGSGFRARRDSMLNYSADSLFFDSVTRLSRLRGNSRISFLDMELNSPYILLNIEENTVKAWTEEKPSPESTCGGYLGLGEKSPDTDLEETNDSLEVPDIDGWPIFTDQRQELRGRKMSFNLKTRQGLVIDGRTSEDISLYGGQRIKRVNDNEMHISNAVFTTCEAGCPHYHFQAKQLKMLLKDRVFAKDVFLHFGNVPTLYTPIALFSLKRGRASGVILPSYGHSNSRGRSLDNLGYYWAVSDYWDTQLKLSYAENGPDWLLYNMTRYKMNKREYGSLSMSYNSTPTSSREGWDLLWNHQNEITPYISLRANLRLVSSGDYYRNNSSNPTTRLTTTANSSINLSGKFPQQGIGWSLSANGNQNLEQSTMSGTLPSYSLSFPSYSPLKFLTENKKAGGTAPSLYEWASGTVLTVRSTGKSSFEMEDWGFWDSESQKGAQHTIGLSVPGKVGVLNLTPQFNAKSDWFDEYQSLHVNSDGSADTLSQDGFITRQTFSFAVTSSTKLYGIARPNIGRLLALRHVLTPTLTYRWAPDFSKDFWGYVDHAIVPGYDADNPDSSFQQEINLDRFYGSMYGSTPVTKTRKLDFSLNQVFQSKWQAPEKPANHADSLAEVDDFKDEKDEDLRMDLLSISTGSSYNFNADGFRLSDFRSSWKIDPLRLLGGSLGPLKTLSMSLSTTHTVYKYDLEGNRIDRYVWQDGDYQNPRLPRLSIVGLSMSTRIGGGIAKSQAKTSLPEVDGFGDEAENRFNPFFISSDINIPGDLSFTWRWNKNMTNPLSPTRSSFVSARGSLRLSKNWKVSTSIQYDIIDKSFSYNDIMIFRDMHCWEGSFRWNPRGANPSYHLLIKVKADMLQDLKWDKRHGRAGPYSSF
jgi:hypothetical protein